MRNWFLSMWSITIPIVPRQAMLVLQDEDGRKTAVQLWVKFALSWVLLFGPMLLMKGISAMWLRRLLGAISMLHCCAPFFTLFSAWFFHIFPGLGFDDAGLLTKAARSLDYACHAYHDIVYIHLVTSPGKRTPDHYVDVGFSDGSSWQSSMRPESEVPFLGQLAALIAEKCGCPVAAIQKTTSR